MFTSCESSNLLIRAKRKNYSEKNHFYLDSSNVIIIQEVRYDKPKSIDEEAWYNLEITINKNVLKDKINYLSLDSDSIQTDFYIFPLEAFKKYHYSISGKVVISNVQNDFLEITENIEIRDRNNKLTNKFSGNRIIKRK